MQTAERASSDLALILAEYALGGCAAVSRRRGRPSPRTGTDGAGPRQIAASALPSLVPVIDMLARRAEMARRGDRDAAISVMRKAVDELHQTGRLRGGYGVFGARSILVEALLERGAEGDLAEAQEEIDRLANLAADDALGDARHHCCCGCARCWPGPAATMLPTGTWRARYRAMAESLGFEGHIAWAEAMIEGG